MENILANQENILVANPPKGRITYSGILTALVLILVGLTGIIPTVIQSVCILACSVLMFFTGGIYLIYPMMLFYGNSLGLLFGISTYRLFTLVFLVITFLRLNAFRFQLRQLAVFFLFVLYCVVVVLPESIRRSLFVILDMFSVLVLINCYLKQESNIKRFFTVYVLCAFFAYFTGTQRDGLEYQAVVNNKYVEMVRNMATFEDPNYMGFFYTGAVFATVGLKLFTPKLRIVAVIALYAILLTSLSVTAIVVNVLLWLVYLLITKAVNIKVFIVILAAIAVVLGLYQYGLANPEDEVLGAFAMRISEKLEQMETGDYGSATSGRSELQKKHLEYFMSQPVYKMLIGMNAASTLKIDLDGYKMAAHNEYIDWLLNVGLIGTAIMVYYLVCSTWVPLKKYRLDTSDRSSLSVVMLKCVWIAYACTLTLYGDYRFMLLFLL